MELHPPEEVLSTVRMKDLDTGLASAMVQVLPKLPAVCMQEILTLIFHFFDIFFSFLYFNRYNIHTYIYIHVCI